jgi:ABC-type polysaccharide/polyol phosphate export permease
LAFPLIALARTAVRHRGLIATFVKRDLKGRYAGSALGSVWAVAQPLVLLAVYSFVFGQIIKMDFRPPGVQKLPEAWTAFFLFSGMVPWLAFSETLGRSTVVILENGNLIKKVAFPSEVLPIYLVVYGLVNMLIGIAILVLGSIYVGLTPGPSLAWLPLLLLLQAMFTLGLGYLLSALNVFVRDTMQVMGLLLTIWMFLTPIFYLVSMVPAGAQRALRWNPMLHLIEAYRAVFVDRVSPSPDSLVVFGGVALGTLFLGYVCFARSKHRFADEI